MYLLFSKIILSKDMYLPVIFENLISEQIAFWQCVRTEYSILLLLFQRDWGLKKNFKEDSFLTL